MHFYSMASFAPLSWKTIQKSGHFLITIHKITWRYCLISGTAPSGCLGNIPQSLCLWCSGKLWGITLISPLTQWGFLLTPVAQTESLPLISKEILSLLLKPVSLRGKSFPLKHVTFILQFVCCPLLNHIKKGLLQTFQPRTSFFVV